MEDAGSTRPWDWDVADPLEIRSYATCAKAKGKVHHTPQRERRRVLISLS